MVFLGARQWDMTQSVTTRAPALMNGLRGMPCSYSSWTKELNLLPDGALPQRVHSSSRTRLMASISVKALEMLWIENGSPAPPTVWPAPSTVAIAMPNLVGGTLASAGI